MEILWDSLVKQRMTGRKEVHRGSYLDWIKSDLVKDGENVKEAAMVETIIRVIMIIRNLQSTLSFNLENDSEMEKSVDMSWATWSGQDKY